MDIDELFGYVQAKTKKAETYYEGETHIGTWFDGNPIYRQVVTVTENLAKDNTIKVCDKPQGMLELTNCRAIIKTTQNSYSANDILVYSSDDGIFVRQNFTSYPEKIYVIFEYTKGE